MNTSLSPDEAARVVGIMQGVTAPNPIISVTFRNSKGEPDPMAIPAQFGEALTLLFMDFMSKSVQDAIAQRKQVQAQLADAREMIEYYERQQKG